ncbi:DUF385 domain-containing protein [Nakamurella sp. YIM 132087]|uniref:DUF385 domain-containing protein n=1 Tax=Nakamurella alba TaxID=2665158 RepID=A0A7K1FN01_9ACTN|nr:nitroreductase/quinone reductase family protein [Nakamurella alba]MTD15460.1 DUF385 domain-containing protein [Nakamurella alba]
MTMTSSRYIRPARMDGVFNRLVGWLARRGISLAGSRQLSVQGRTSGEWRSTPVNPMTLDGVRYLVSPRGITQWVRNIRVSGTGRLTKGRAVEEFRAVEVADADKPAILRAYLKAWKWEVGRFFENLDEHASDERLLQEAPGFPVFRIEQI